LVLFDIDDFGVAIFIVFDIFVQVISDSSLLVC